MVHQVALQYLRHQRVQVLLVEVVAEQGEDGGAAEVHQSLRSLWTRTWTRENQYHMPLKSLTFVYLIMLEQFNGEVFPIHVGSLMEEDLS